MISISSLLFFFLFIIFPLNAEAHHNPYVLSFTCSASHTQFTFVTVCNLWLNCMYLALQIFKHLRLNPIHVGKTLLDFQKEQNKSLKN